MMHRITLSVRFGKKLLYIFKNLAYLPCLCGAVVECEVRDLAPRQFFYHFQQMVRGSRKIKFVENYINFRVVEA